MTWDMVPPCTDGDTEAQDSSAWPLLLAFVSNPHAKNQQTCVVLIPNLATSHPEPISFLIHAPTFYHQTMVTAAKDPRLPLQSPPSLQRSEEAPTPQLFHSKQDLPFPLLCVLHSPLHFITAPPTGQASSYPRAFALATCTAWNIHPPDGHMALTLIGLGLCSNIIHLFLVS